MKTNRYIPIFAAAALLAACAQEIERPEPRPGAAVEFAASIAGEAPATRTTSGGNSWVLNDSVGIYMLKAGGSLTLAADRLASNAYYSVSNVSTGALTPKGTPIYYPVSGNVDFVAYYPAGVVRTSDYTYGISVKDQQTMTEVRQNQLDVMWADRRNIASGTAVSLSFRHVMSKITLNVMAGKNFVSNDVKALTTVSFKGMWAEARLKLQDGTLTPVEPKADFSARKLPTATTNFDASFTAILVPQSGTTKPTGRTVAFTFPDGNSYVWAIPDTTNFVAGKHYTYPVTINRDSIVVEDSETTAIGWGTPHDNDPGGADPVGTITQAKIDAITTLLNDLEAADKNKTVAVLREEDLTAIAPAVLAILNDPILDPYKTLEQNIDELNKLKPTP